MKIGLVGYQGSGKSTLFEFLTGIRPDPAQAHVGQSAMSPVPEARVEPLCAVYHPKKVTLAALELLDTPGLARSHEGNAARLSVLREAGCLVLVVGAFSGQDWRQDLRSFREDLLLADMQIVSGRIDKLRDSVKKPRPNRDQELAELAALEPMLTALEEGKALAEMTFTEEQLKATRSFRLLTEKPTLIVVNVADDETDLQKYTAAAADQRIFAAPLGLELELARMTPEDRSAFQKEMGLSGSCHDDLIRLILDVSGQMLYFTAGEKEVRTWMLHKGGTALEAAENIHSDLARGFIRAETMHCDDLIRLGSEREVKAAHLVRQEPKDYVVRDGDILHIKFSV